MCRAAGEAGRADGVSVLRLVAGKDAGLGVEAGVEAPLPGAEGAAGQSTEGLKR